MSFSSDVRGELARFKTDDICCARSELSAALLASGGIAWRGRGRYALTVTASDAATVRRYFSMLKHHWAVTGQIRALSGDVLNNQTRYQLAIPEAESLKLLEALDLLDEAGLFGLRQTPGDDVTRFACCKKAFVRAAFLMCGNISNPEKSYHIEFAAPTEPFARRVAACLEYFGLTPRVSLRRNQYMAYLKRAEDISDTLTLMGTATAVLAMENIRVRKEVSNHVNRQMNFDASNINLVVDAAEAQIRDIHYIDSELGLDRLPKSLREMAFARANNPETPLAGLGELLDPPIGKSGVNARLRRLTEIADKLRSGEEIHLREKRPRGHGESGR